MNRKRIIGHHISGAWRGSVPLKALLVIGGIGVLLFTSLGIVKHVFWAAPRLDQVRIGMTISELSKVISSSQRLRDGQVTKWILARDKEAYHDVPPLKTATQSITYDAVLKRDLGDFASWKPSTSERAKFCGQITFFRTVFLGNIQVVSLTFIDGRLVQKDWGWAPG